MIEQNSPRTTQAIKILKQNLKLFKNSLNKPQTPPQLPTIPSSNILPLLLTKDAENLILISKLKIQKYSLKTNSLLASHDLKNMAKESMLQKVYPNFYLDEKVTVDSKGNKLLLKVYSNNQELFFIFSLKTGKSKIIQMEDSTDFGKESLTNTDNIYFNEKIFYLDKHIHRNTTFLRIMEINSTTAEKAIFTTFRSQKSGNIYPLHSLNCLIFLEDSSNRGVEQQNLEFRIYYQRSKTLLYKGTLDSDVPAFKFKTLNHKVLFQKSEENGNFKAVVNGGLNRGCPVFINFAQRKAWLQYKHYNVRAVVKKLKNEKEYKSEIKHEKEGDYCLYRDPTLVVPCGDMMVRNQENELFVLKQDISIGIRCVKIINHSRKRVIKRLFSEDLSNGFILNQVLDERKGILRTFFIKNFRNDNFSWIRVVDYNFKTKKRNLVEQKILDYSVELHIPAGSIPVFTTFRSDELRTDICFLTKRVYNEEEVIQKNKIILTKMNFSTGKLVQVPLKQYEYSQSHLCDVSLEQSYFLGEDLFGCVCVDKNTFLSHLFIVDFAQKTILKKIQIGADVNFEKVIGSNSSRVYIRDIKVARGKTKIVEILIDEKKNLKEIEHLVKEEIPLKLSKIVFGNIVTLFQTEEDEELGLKILNFFNNQKKEIILPVEIQEKISGFEANNGGNGAQRLEQKFKFLKGRFSEEFPIFKLSVSFFLFNH